MKKILALFAALTLVLTLAACGRAKPAPTAPAEPSEHASALRFQTVDRMGNAADESLLAGHSLVILNFWEPWCGPCVGEMPELEKLYEAYKDKGLLILGVYSAEDMEESVDAILEKAGTSYPILRGCKDFDVFATGYVPTTVFVDGAGNILSELLVGSRDYAGWEELVLNVLK